LFQRVATRHESSSENVPLVDGCPLTRELYTLPADAASFLRQAVEIMAHNVLHSDFSLAQRLIAGLEASNPIEPGSPGFP
jgi:hypothetical protein